jgi:serralysin
MNGNEGNDIIQARGGNDSLIGGRGNDVLDGGAGADRLSGGTGNDRYDFNKVSDSGKTAATRDKILDFFPGQDSIDLFNIDAKTGGAPNDMFKFIGTQGFHGVKGELHYVKFNGFVIVEGDVNGDRKADFQIEVRGVTSLAANDFEL